LEAIAGSGDARQVLQVVYSDGLTHVSVFIEPYDVQRHKPMRTSLGATQTSMSRQGDWWITVMGDVPMTTVQQFETVLQRK
jgi:sigma-E factor negative regulatory protein RseB